MNSEREKIYGLVGKNISYSFSKTFFTQKFKELNLKKYSYLNFDLKDLSHFKALFKKHRISGLNVTIPYKQEVLPFLDDLSGVAKSIGAVNTIKILNGKLIGYNTDAFGFEKSLLSVCDETNGLALILGTGGASMAVNYVLLKLGFEVVFVSRNSKNKAHLSYNKLTKELMSKVKLIVNCTPLGTYPNTTDFPNIPYQYLHKNQILFDLVYNPPQTSFLLKGLERGAQIKNGYDMLVFQAEKSWEIWNS
jgi:shikimate dehydrogenase